MFNKIIVALICFPLSFIMIYYRRQLKDLMGNIGFAEKYLGQGGTHTLILLLAIALFIFTLLYVTGTLESFLYNTFSPILFS